MRFLFATTRGAGHLAPLIPLARACLRAGHEVLVAGPGSIGPLVQRAGLPFAAVPEAPREQVAAAFAPVWASTAQASYVLSDLFVGMHARIALPGMLETVERWRPAVVVRETLEFSSALAAERHGIAQVRFGVHLDAQTDADGRLLGFAAPALDALRAPIGLAPDPEARAIAQSPLFSLAPRSLDDPAAPQPAPVQRFRDPVAVAPRNGAGEPPLVYVSFGSEAPASEHFPRVYRAAAEALADLPVRVLMTIGDERDPADLGKLPANVRVERWVPQAKAMAQAAAMVGHGGSGSTLAALAAGIPQAFMPLFVDGPRNASRVAELGAGIVVDGDLAGAVRELLDSPTYRRAAVAIAGEIGALPPIDDAVAAIAG